MNKRMIKSAKTILLTTLLSSVTLTSADDTDIIDISKEPNSNILLIMDMSLSMANKTTGDTLPSPPEKSRKDVAIEALADVLNDPLIRDLNVNVGISSFSGNTASAMSAQTAHGISFPVSPLYDNSSPPNKEIALDVINSNSVWNQNSSATYFHAKSGYVSNGSYTIGTPGDGPVNSMMSTPNPSTMSIIDYLSTTSVNPTDEYTIPDQWTPWGVTPIVDALYEAALYFRGDEPYYGRRDPSDKRAAHPSTYENLLYAKREPLIYDEVRDCNDSSTSILHDPALEDCLLTSDINHLDLNTTPPASPALTNPHTVPVYEGCTKFTAGFSSPETVCYQDQTIKLTTMAAAPTNYRCNAETNTFSTRSCTATECTSYNSGLIFGQSCTTGNNTEYRNCNNMDIPSTATSPSDITAAVGTILSACAVSHSVADSECVSGPVQNVVDQVDSEGSAISYKNIVTISCLVPITPENICREITNNYRSCGYDKTRNQERRKKYTSQDTIVKHSTSDPANYISPIKEECPSNSIILLSDGRPTANSNAAAARTYVNINNTALTNTCASETISGTSIPAPGRCGNELARFLANTDHNSSLTGAQVVNTHTIGFALGAGPLALKAKTYLQGLAANGAGSYAAADDLPTLKAAIFNAITSTAKAHSFSSPTYISTATSMSRGEFVYVPVFDKSNSTVWEGNLKKYKRSGGRLIDRDGNNATNSIGTLIDTAPDFWTPPATPSTSAVLSGGVANALPAPNSRKLYTDAGISGTNVTFGSANVLKTSNTMLTKTLLGDAGMSDAYRTDLIKFIRGEKSDGTARKHIGDIIHSKPVYVDYGSEKRLFVGTNEGFLHSFDESTTGGGEEKFAFMPSILLENVKPQFESTAQPNHIYGVDGPITLQHDDSNFNGVVDSGETAVLYFGLRRGGKAYYAIDISIKDSPKLRWKIEQNLTFDKLGYSWSKPVVMKMKTSSSTTEQVIVFGGGYVDDNATPSEAENSGTGADVYIVRASDGTLVWKLSGSNTELTNTGTTVSYAVPGNIRAMDISGNDLLDRLYFGDTGGNIWRVDFEPDWLTSSNKAKLTHFAELGYSGGLISVPGTSIRKFFTEPDVALLKAKGMNRISVAIGSGNRPSPLPAVELADGDAFFVMFDKNVVSIPDNTTTIITKSDLEDASSGSVSGALSTTKTGWFMNLTKLKHEKVLSRATTYNNKIIFNTFGGRYTTSTSTTGCGAPNVNKTRLYIIDLVTAKSVVDLDENGTVVPSGTLDRSKEVAEGEIPGAPQILFDMPTCTAGNCPINAKVSSGRGLEISLGDSKVLRKVYWIDEEE